MPAGVALVTTSGGRATVTSWPPTGALAVGAESVPGVPAAAALWEMVNVVPAIDSVALRAAPLLAATVAVTVPEPLPVAPAVMVTKVALLVAVHVQPVPAVTGTVAVPPAAPNVDALIEPAVIVHDGVVGVSSFEHADAAISSNTAVRRRQDFIMPPSITEIRGHPAERAAGNCRDPMPGCDAHDRGSQREECRGR